MKPKNIKTLNALNASQAIEKKIKPVSELEFESVKSQWIRDMQFSVYFRAESFDLCSPGQHKQCHNLVEQFRGDTFELMEIAQKCTNYEELKAVIMQTHEEFGRMHRTISKWVRPEWTGFFAFAQYSSVSFLAKPDEYIEKARAAFKHEFPESIWNMLPKFLQAKIQKSYVYTQYKADELKELDKKAVGLCAKFGLKEFSFNTDFWTTKELIESIVRLDETLAGVCKTIGIENKDLGFNSKIGFEMEPGYKKGGLYEIETKKITLSGQTSNAVVHEIVHAIDNILAQEMGLGDKEFVSEPGERDYAPALVGATGGVQITNKKMQSNPYFGAYCEFKKMANLALASEKIINHSAVKQLEFEAGEMFAYHTLGIDYYKLSESEKNLLVDEEFISNLKRLLNFNFEEMVGRHNEMRQVSQKLSTHISASIDKFNKNKDPSLKINAINAADIYAKMADRKCMEKVHSLFCVAKDPTFYLSSNAKVKAAIASGICAFMYGAEKGVIKISNFLFSENKAIDSHKNGAYLQEPKEMLARALEMSFYNNQMQHEVIEGMGLVYTKAPKSASIRQSLSHIFGQAKVAAFRGEGDAEKYDDKAAKSGLSV